MRNKKTSYIITVRLTTPFFIEISMKGSQDAKNRFSIQYKWVMLTHDQPNSISSTTYGLLSPSRSKYIKLNTIYKCKTINTEPEVSFDIAEYSTKAKPKLIGNPVFSAALAKIANI